MSSTPHSTAAVASAAALHSAADSASSAAASAAAAAPSAAASFPLDRPRPRGCSPQAKRAKQSHSETAAADTHSKSAAAAASPHAAAGFSPLAAASHHQSTAAPTHSAADSTRRDAAMHRQPQRADEEMRDARPMRSPAAAAGRAADDLSSAAPTHSNDVSPALQQAMQSPSALSMLAATQLQLRDTQAALAERATSEAAMLVRIRQLEARLAAKDSASSAGRSIAGRSSSQQPLQLTATAAASSSAAASQLSPRAFDSAMADPCMLAMLLSLTPNDRIRSIRVSRRWMSCVKQPALWSSVRRAFPFRGRAELSPLPQWLLPLLGGLDAGLAAMHALGVAAARTDHPQCLTRIHDLRLNVESSSLSEGGLAALRAMPLRKLELSGSLYTSGLALSDTERPAAELPHICLWSQTLQEFSVYFPLECEPMPALDDDGNPSEEWDSHGNLLCHPDQLNDLLTAMLQVNSWPQLRLITLIAPTRETEGVDGPEPRPASDASHTSLRRLFTATRLPALQQLCFLEPPLLKGARSLLATLIECVERERFPLTHFALARSPKPDRGDDFDEDDFDENGEPHPPELLSLSLPLPESITKLRLWLPPSTLPADFDRVTLLRLTDLAICGDAAVLKTMLHLAADLPLLESLRLTHAYGIGQQLASASREENRQLLSRLSVATLSVADFDTKCLHGILAELDAVSLLTSLDVQGQLPASVTPAVMHAIANSVKLETLTLRHTNGVVQLAEHLARRCGFAPMQHAAGADATQPTLEAAASAQPAAAAAAASSTAPIALATPNPAASSGVGSSAVPPVLLRSLKFAIELGSLNRATLTNLSRIPLLRTVVVNGGAAITADDLESFKLLRHLRVLRLDEIRSGYWTDDLMQRWTEAGSFPFLETLAINNCFQFDANNFEFDQAAFQVRFSVRRGLTQLWNLPRLQHLELGPLHASAMEILQQANDTMRTARGLPEVQISSLPPAHIFSRSHLLPIPSQSWETWAATADEAER